MNKCFIGHVLVSLTGETMMMNYAVGVCRQLEVGVAVFRDGHKQDTLGLASGWYRCYLSCVSPYGSYSYESCGVEEVANAEGAPR